MSKPTCNQCKMRATCQLQFNKIVERRPEKPNGHSGGCVYFGVLSCDEFCDTACLSDIIDGKATRDLKKGETIIVDIHDWESLKYRPGGVRQ